MEDIRSANYEYTGEDDIQTCTVEFFNGTTQIFTTQEDFIKVQQKLKEQSERFAQQ